jgi:preprotein translocase subunit SecE
MSVIDVVKQIFSIVFVIAGLAGFYYFSDIRLIYRVLGLLSVLIAAVALIATTTWGISIRGFVAESENRSSKDSTANAR